jgi:signal transduction histidine kinase
VKRRLVIAATVCVCCWLGMVGLVSEAHAAPPGRTLEHARFLLAGDATPPADERAWSDITLPDNWSTTRQQASGIGWYRMSFEQGSDAGKSVAVLVRRLSMNGEFFINGVKVLSGGRMTPPVTRNWNMPFFVEIPPALLRAGRNVLDIRIYANRNSNSGLGTVYLGEPDALRAHYLFLNALHVKGAILSFAVALVAAFIGIVAWLRMGHDAVYGFFGLAMVEWAVRYGNYFVQTVPIDQTVYSLAVNSAQGWFFIFFTFFLLRLTGVRWPRVDRALYGMGILGTVGIYAAFRGWVPIWLVIGVWMCVWLPCSAALLLVSARYAYKSRSVLAAMAALVAWLYVPLTLRELLITSGFMPFDASYIAHYVGAPLAVLISWMLIDRVVDSARAAAQADLARAKAAFDERLRITQDMHDGLGLQLNAALRVAERGEIDREKFASLLRACLEELRLIVDSSASDTGTFLPLLASLRMRMQSKLEAIGIRIDWQMHRFPGDLTLPPDATLHVLRMVQEAINNAIKHANASVIAFRVAEGRTHDHFKLVITDNGAGFAASAGTEGKGLSGMKRRAIAAGVGFAVHSSSEGTSIEIEIPGVPATEILPSTIESRP